MFITAMMSEQYCNNIVNNLVHAGHLRAQPRSYWPAQSCVRVYMEISFHISPSYIFDVTSVNFNSKKSMKMRFDKIFYNFS